MNFPMRSIVFVLFVVTLLSAPAFAQSQSDDSGIVRIRYATVVVPDYNEALHWYTNVLGLEKVEEGNFGAGLRWLVVAPHGEKNFGIVLELARPIDNQDKIQNYQERVGKETRWVFEVKDCRKYSDLLAKRGVKIIDPPAEQSWGMKAQIEDPYGNVFVLWSPKNPPGH